MYKVFGLQNINVIYNMLHLQYLKSVDISGVPKKGYRRPTNSKAEKPAVPHLERSPGQPRPTDRDHLKLGQNRARNTSLSVGLMHQPTPPARIAPTPKPKPAKTPARTRGTRNSTSLSLRLRSNPSRPLHGHPARHSSP